MLEWLTDSIQRPANSLDLWVKSGIHSHSEHSPDSRNRDHGPGIYSTILILCEYYAIPFMLKWYIVSNTHFLSRPAEAMDLWVASGIDNHSECTPESWSIPPDIAIKCNYHLPEFTIL